MQTSDQRVLAGRYRVGGLLGRGGMAEVYDGFDERLHRSVAVKLLRPEMAARDDIRLRFEAEARSAAALGHPNVVGVYDTGEDDGVPFIVMERLPGETLADRMAAGPLDPAWVRRVAGDVLLALEAAHAAGLVHRDVKPGNILLASDGCAKVADFGIAKSLEVASQSVTATAQLVGTPAYLAPERIDGDAASPQSDIYSVGVVLYEALTGRKAFDGKTPVAVAYAVRHQPPPALAELRADLPDDLVAAVERAMHADPAARFGTAREMAMALGVATPIGDAPTVAVTALAGSGDETRVMPAVASQPDRSPDADPAPVTAVPLSERSGVAVPTRPQLLVGGVVALLLMLLLLPLCRGGGDGRSGISADLRSVAGSMDQDDGRRHEEAAEGATRVADAVDAGGGADMANQLLRQVATWRASGELRPDAATRLQEALLQVPGTDSANAVPPTTAPPPPPSTTQPPPQEDEKRDEEEKEGDGGKRGKGKGDDD